MNIVSRSLQFMTLCLLGAFAICPFPTMVAGQESPSSATARSELKPGDELLRLNEIQVIGTHNSYHLAPVPELMKIIGLTGKAVADSIDYTHPALPVQYSEHGIRQIELDLYADPDGGLYSSPVGLQVTKLDKPHPKIDYDFNQIMQRPGTKIIHAPGFDFASHVPTLQLALEQTVAWSKSHPGHLPIMILLELKESATGPAGVKALRFDKGLLDQLDEEIRSVVPASMLVTPDTVRGDSDCLRDAIEQRGWPLVKDCCGKLLFALDNTDGLRDRYLDGHDSLRGRVMFASVDAQHPAAAWKIGRAHV